MESSYQAQWNYYIGISNKTQVAMNKAKEIMAAFDKKSWKKIFTKYDYKKFKNTLDKIIRKQASNHIKNSSTNSY